MINGIRLSENNISPQQRRIRLMELGNIPLNEKQKKNLQPRNCKCINEVVSMKEIPKNRKSLVPKKPHSQPEDEVDLEEILKEMGYGESEEEEDLKMEDINISDKELQSIVDDLEDDSVNEFNSPSKGYKEGRKLVDTLRKGLFRKFSDDDLDEFMDVISNSFNLVRK